MANQAFIAKNGFDAYGNQIKGMSAGTDATDAVNVTQLNGRQPLDSDLTAISALTTTGLLTRTGTGTATTRTITGSNGITITNGNGVSGEPTISPTYGTIANTITQGNDSRLSNSREWTADTVTQVEAEAGTATTRRAWTAERVRQAIVAAVGTVSGIVQTIIKMVNGAITTVTLTTSTVTPNQVLDSTTSRSAKYTIQVTSGSAYQITELLCVHNGTLSHCVEYGTVSTGANLATITTDFNGGNMRVTVTPVNAVTTFKAIRQEIYV